MWLSVKCKKKKKKQRMQGADIVDWLSRQPVWQKPTAKAWIWLHTRLFVWLNAKNIKKKTQTAIICKPHKYNLYSQNNIENTPNV